MERFLKRKEKDVEIWISGDVGPYIPTRQVVRDASVNLMGQEEVRLAPPTLMNEKKMHGDDVCFSKLVLVSLISL